MQLLIPARARIRRAWAAQELSAARPWTCHLSVELTKLCTLSRLAPARPLSGTSRLLLSALPTKLSTLRRDRLTPTLSRRRMRLSVSRKRTAESSKGNLFFAPWLGENASRIVVWASCSFCWGPVARLGEEHGEEVLCASSSVEKQLASSPSLAPLCSGRINEELILDSTGQRAAGRDVSLLE